MQQATTSLQIFRKHIYRHPEDGKLNVSGVISHACYKEWLQCKQLVESDDSARRYQRNLQNHVSGVDGRSPFTEEEEAAILELFRKRLPWPCFPAHLSDIGKRYRSKGYHEKARIEVERAPIILPELPTFMSFAPIHQNTPPPALPSSAPPVPDFPPLSPSASTSSLDLRHIFDALPPADAEAVRALAESVCKHFVAYDHSCVDWKSIQELIRFFVIGKLMPTQHIYPEVDQGELARRLCEEYSTLLGANAAVFVLNIMGKVGRENMLAQNQRSIDLFGVKDDNPSVREVSQVYAIVVATAAAAHQPGTVFTIKLVHHDSALDQTTWFNFSFYMDPASMLLIVTARE